MIAYREKEFEVVVYYIPLSIKVLNCQVYYSFLPHLELIANILMYRKWILISTNTWVDIEVIWDLEGGLVPLKCPGLISYGALEVGSLLTPKIY